MKTGILESMMIQGHPAISIFLWASFIVMALYMSRKTVHSMVSKMVDAISGMLELGGNSMKNAEQKLRERNKEVLLELGRQQEEREIEREYIRIQNLVERDLGKYPEYQKIIANQVTQIEEDYKKSGQLVPPPPEWVEAVEAVAKLNLDKKHNGLTANILKNIHDASMKQQKESIQEYRQSITERHRLLESMRPYWRKLATAVDEVGTTVKRLLERTNEIDNHMARYEEIRRGTEKAERTLRASAATQFAVSLFVVLIAVGGAIINFNLIALPMSEMVGATARLGPYKVSDIAALVIIFVEISMGIFLMEALRFTRLFPLIGAMDDRMRHRMIWITFTILFSLACVESALAFMRDQIAADLSALRMSLSQGGGEQVVEVEGVNSWIPMLGQMVMGFILPFALTFVAIPLESLVHSCRSVFGDLLVLALRGGAALMRMTSHLIRHTGQFLNHLYDVIIFMPLWLEKFIHARRVRFDDETEDEDEEEKAPFVATSPGLAMNEPTLETEQVAK